MNEDCTKYKDLLLEIEKLRGEIKSIGTRVSVHEGNLNSNISRLHIRVDTLAKDIKTLREDQAKNNAAQQQEIDRLKLHFRYLGGLAAGIIFLLNFAKRIKEFFIP